MVLFELLMLAPVAAVEQLGEALEALDALSVSVEDADAQTPAEHALFGEPGMPPPQPGWECSRVVALFANQALAQDAAQVLSAQDFFVNCQVLGLNLVPEQDWVRLTQSQFTPVEITPEFWIVPTWHEPPAQATKVIRLDPGLAFGTGTHPTTRLCLRWIAGYAAPTLVASRTALPPEGAGLAWGGPALAALAPTLVASRTALIVEGAVGSSRLGRVLDYGCGSGILAMGAAAFGGFPIDAVDIDPAAVQSTIDNANANHVSLNVGLPNTAAGAYQTVLANILATPLKVLAPLLCAYVKTGGHLVLAGILERQAEELKTAYASYCTLTVADQEEGWVLMTACL